MRRSVRVVTVAVAALGASCSRGPHQDLGRRIADEVAKGAGTIVRMTDLTDFSWERLHVFAPYSSPELIDRELGFRWPEADDTGIQSSDGIALLVFVEGRAVARYVVQPRNKGDFASSSGAFSSSESTFLVTPRGDGAFLMVPVRTGGK